MDGTSIDIEPELGERLRRVALAQRREPSSVMRDAIAQYVEREESLQSFVGEARESLRHYRETGLHLTGDEVAKWLETWGTDEEVDAPECHG